MTPDDPIPPATDDPALLDTWWREHHGGVRAFLRGCGATYDDAEDALGETFARAASAAAQGHVPHHPGAWLRRIALRSLSDQRLVRARQADRVTRLSRGAPGVAPSAAEECARRADARSILAAMAALPVHERTALEAYAIHGLSSDEIARHAGTNAATVRKRLTRARTRMRAVTQAALVAVLPVKLQQRLAIHVGVLDAHGVGLGASSTAGTGVGAAAAAVCCAVVGLAAGPGYVFTPPSRDPPRVDVTVTAADGRVVLRHRCPGVLGAHDRVDRTCRRLFYGSDRSIARTLVHLDAVRVVGRQAGHVTSVATMSSDRLVLRLYPGHGNPGLRRTFTKTCRVRYGAARVSRCTRWYAAAARPAR